MKNDVMSADQYYQQAEEEARQYFNVLYKEVIDKSYLDTLVDDFHWWGKNHIHSSKLFTLFSLKKRKPNSKDSVRYIKWLDYTNQLDDYLNRSISYIYLRDLGKTLDDPTTNLKINRVVEQVKEQLLLSSKNNENELFTFDWIIKKAKEEQIEVVVDWLINKLNKVATKIPEKLDAVNAERKLVKIIAGVLMHTMDELDDQVSSAERINKLEDAIRLGYSYGLTYPFIDDLLDSNLLSVKEKAQYSQLIRTSLLTGTVPPLNERSWSKETLEFIGFIHQELKEAFEFIQSHQKSDKFFQQAYIFFQSQEVDRRKDLDFTNYSNEELYIPIILKSSSSRLIARAVIQETDEDFEQRTFLYGIYNQLADDFADMFEDLEMGAVTPYTYYMTHYDKRRDLINPFEMYWAVIMNLIHRVYHADVKTKDVILKRAINGLKRFKEKHGHTKYRQVMEMFTKDIPQLKDLLQRVVGKADDVAFFDKLLRDQMIDSLKRERKERDYFKAKIKDVKEQINQHLPIADEPFLLKDDLIEAANYSLVGDGKRLRPIISWFVGVEMYGLKESALVPLFNSLEYMHTASLIFDDLPSQDDASIRRGRPTVHEIYNVALAELTGLFLTQKAMEQQTLLQDFDARNVLELVRYSAQVTANMCKGQGLDLLSKERKFTLEELHTMGFYKTSLGFEASLLMPAILANASEMERNSLKKFARHAGIAFQIKDDLLDRIGDATILGKPVGKDVDNETSTFVTILGIEGAKKAMWEQYCFALEALKEIPHETNFLKQLLNYLVFRNS
ncbi:polyprenyl synthetase family protein [Lysinibacillus halotolerans]|uniref:Polyprenyl synthetase family protein n=1 Tax=Lysinibacillus halotolerans TaxID=1368476 RepID=A0A3M8HBU7_9BACI|nr:polyprenyl synthetase family protein [Lysinibacillus halotolerans]RNC99778.1 polyprenyl synthetase family protein [Lysinibacillus halotolerans]